MIHEQCACGQPEDQRYPPSRLPCRHHVAILKGLQMYTRVQFIFISIDAKKPLL